MTEPVEGAIHPPLSVNGPSLTATVRKVDGGWQAVLRTPAGAEIPSTTLPTKAEAQRVAKAAT